MKDGGSADTVDKLWVKFHNQWGDIDDKVYSYETIKTFWLKGFQAGYEHGKNEELELRIDGGKYPISNSGGL